MNNLKAKVDDLDVDSLNTAPLDLKEPSDIVREKVLKKTVYNKLNSIVNNLQNKTPHVSNVTQTHQCNTEKDKLYKNIEHIDKKYVTSVFKPIQGRGGKGGW